MPVKCYNCITVNRMAYSKIRLKSGFSPALNRLIRGFIMAVSYFVHYEGESADPARFLEYYRTQHAAILRRFPGILTLNLHTPIAWSDPFAVNQGRNTLLAQMRFESREALDLALRSEARADARDDFNNFPEFHGTVYHQAMLEEKVF